MSQITRCPACGTMFKVVPDQLRISQGWVRCGHCTDVFDATAHLQPDDEEMLRSVSPPADAGPESESFASSLNTEVDEAMPWQAPDSALLDAEAQALREHPLDQPFVLRRQDTPISEASPARAHPDSEPELHDLSFVRHARRQAFWRQPLVRTMLVLAILLLGGMLALQMAVQDRDRLAATHPGLRPILVAACSVLNCRIRPPRHIDAIAIDGSSFNKLRGDTYRLSVTLKNQAPIPVAMPALELTLTDGQEQAVVRRVLVASELAPKLIVIPAGAEWNGSLALNVSGNGNGAVARFAGYRLLAFYP